MELGKNVTILHSIDRAVADVYVKKIADILAPTYESTDSTPVPTEVLIDALFDLHHISSSLLTCMFTGIIPVKIPGRTRIYHSSSPRSSIFLKTEILYGTGAATGAKFNPRKLSPMAATALVKLAFKHQRTMGNVPYTNNVDKVVTLSRLADKVTTILSRGTNPPPYNPTTDVLGPGLFAIKRRGVEVTTDEGYSRTNEGEAALYMERLPSYTVHKRGIDSGYVSGIICSDRYRDYLNSDQFTDADRIALARLFNPMASQAQFRTGYIPN